MKSHACKCTNSVKSKFQISSCTCQLLISRLSYFYWYSHTFFFYSGNPNKFSVKPIFNRFPNADKTNLICGLASLIQLFVQSFPEDLFAKVLKEVFFYMDYYLKMCIKKIKENKTYNKQSLKPAAVWKINLTTYLCLVNCRHQWM